MERFLQRKEVEGRVGLKRSKLYDLMARGEFPKPIKIDGAARWPESKVSAWIAARIAESEVGEAA